MHRAPRMPVRIRPRSEELYKHLAIMSRSVALVVEHNAPLRKLVGVLMQNLGYVIDDSNNHAARWRLSLERGWAGVMRPDAGYLTQDRCKHGSREAS